jgi:hypothetical protein
MDPDTVTVVVSALSAGAAAGLKDTATNAVKDAYAGLKRLVTDRYLVDVSPLESKPHSEAKRASLAEDLQEAGADADVEVLEAAQRVIAVVAAHAPDTGPAIGIDLERLEAAASVRIRDVTATGTGVRGEDWKVGGDLDISGIHAGSPDGPQGPSPR